MDGALRTGAPLAITRIDHVQLAMPAGEEETAREFYSGALGLPEVPKPTELAGRGGAWFAHGSVQVHLGVEADFRPARKAHPAFVVDRLAETLESLSSRGCELTEPEEIESRLRAFVYDPFGNRIELVDGEEPTRA